MLHEEATMRSKSVLVAASLLVACGAESPPAPEPLDPGRKAILNGKTDSNHTAVVGVYRDAGSDSELCTGYVIMPDLVLTARHCVSKLVNPTAGCGGATQTTADTAFDAGKFAVLTQTSPPAPKGLAVAEVLVLDDPVLCGNDLALLRLEAALDGVTPIAPRLDDAPVVGETLTVIGYGASKGGSTTTSGVRRSLEGVSVLSVGKGTKTGEGEWVVSEGPCAGDSGGPALDASGASIGVMSRGNQSTCKNMIYERLDVHADWLRQAGQASAARLGVDAPAWALGAAGSGGASGEGGAAGQDGEAGSSAAGGDAAGGGAGQPGAAGQAGSDAAGSGGATAGSGGAAAGSGGAAAGSAGQGAPAQTGAAPAASETGDDGGCSAAPARGGGVWTLLAALLAGAGLRRRKGLPGSRRPSLPRSAPTTRGVCAAPQPVAGRGPSPASSAAPACYPRP